MLTMDYLYHIQGRDVNGWWLVCEEEGVLKGGCETRDDIWDWVVLNISAT